MPPRSIPGSRLGASAEMRGCAQSDVIMAITTITTRMTIMYNNDSDKDNNHNNNEVVPRAM